MTKNLGVYILFALLGMNLAHAEQSKPPRVGILLPTSPNQSAARVKAFIAGLAENGLVEGRTVVIEARYAPGGVTEQEKFAGDLVALPVDVLLTSATGPTLAAKKATNTIPIVFAIAGDAVASGLVESFERPGGNVTGVPDSGPEMAGKRLATLKEALPHITRVAVIGNSKPKQQAAAKRSLETTARKLGIALLFTDVATGKDISRAFSNAKEWRSEAFITMSQSLTSNEQAQIVEQAAKANLPLLFHRPEGVEAGALMSLADDANQIFRSASGYVAKILKGSSPATMPIVPVANAELVINLRTAKALGITIPPELLKRATRVIR